MKGIIYLLGIICLVFMLVGCFNATNEKEQIGLREMFAEGDKYSLKPKAHEDNIRNESLVESKSNSRFTVYNSDTLKIKIEPIIKENPAQRMWITTVQVKDIRQVRAAFAKDEFCLTEREKTSSIAKRHGAILAINGDACGFNNNSLIIRNGILCRESTVINSLLFDKTGVLRFETNSKKSAEELINEGVIHSFLFAPPLIADGKMGSWMVKEDGAPRTGIGQRTPYEYIILTADGRSKNSQGLTTYEMAQIFKDLGCHTAYNLDGGGSTTLYFNGKVINNPSDFTGERAISDILFFTD